MGRSCWGNQGGNVLSELEYSSLLEYGLNDPRLYVGPAGIIWTGQEECLKGLWRARPKVSSSKQASHALPEKR